MVEQPKTPPNEAPNDSAVKPLNPTRRRWLQAGLSASPVLMTVISRPVLAAQCVAPSAFVSLGASGVMYAVCDGKGPTAWSDAASWPSPYCPGTASSNCGDASLFNPIFDPDLDGNPTLLAVLTGPNEVAKYVVAALLNSSGPSPLVPANVLGAPTIMHIWSEFATMGHFTPSPGASWSAAEIVDYLKSTMNTG